MLRSVLGWSKIQILLHALGEKTLVIYLWGGLFFYAVTSFLKSLSEYPQTESVSDAILNWDIPAFLIIGFVHAISLFSAKHLYVAGSPQEIQERWTEQRILASVDKKRQSLVKEFSSRIKSLETMHESVVRSSLPPEIESQSSEIVKAVSDVLLAGQWRAEEFEKTKTEIENISVRNLETANPPILALTIFFLVISLGAWLMHLSKLMLWALGFVK